MHSNISGMKINKNVAISEAGLVFNPVTGESFTANPAGAEIIGMIQEGKTREEIIAEFTGKYNTDVSSFEKDLQDFIHMLSHYHIMEENEEKNA